MVTTLITPIRGFLNQVPTFCLSRTRSLKNKTLLAQFAAEAKLGGV